MEKETRTVGSILNQINSLQRMEENLLKMTQLVDKDNFPNLGFEPVPFLTQVRIEITKEKEALKLELYDTEITSNLFKIV